MIKSLNRIVKINNKNVNYKREGDFLAREVALFEKAVDRAFLMAKMSSNILNNARISKSDVEFLFGDSSYKTMDSLKESFKNVQETFFTNFTLSREKVYSQGNSDVLASTKPEANKITLYDAFFEYSSDVKILGAVLLHEFLHLAGLDSEDANMNLESAKAVGFLSELLCKIKSREAVQNEIEKLENSGGESDDSQEELYDPNPNRHPNGQSNGGQFAPKNNKKSDETSDSSTHTREEGKSQKSNPSSVSEEDDDLERGEILANRYGNISSEINEQMYIDMVNFTNASNSEDPITFIADIDPLRNHLYNFFSGKMDFKDNKDGYWSSKDISISNLKPNSDETFVQKVTYRYKDKNGKNVKKPSPLL